MQTTGRILAALVALATTFHLMPSDAGASPLPIVATPQATSGPFRHNVFHTASSNGGAGGSILAWFDIKLASELGLGESNFYDPMTGDFELHVNIYNDSALTDLIGMGWAFDGDPIAASELNAPDDGTLAGTIDWEIMFNTAGESSALATHLESNSLESGFTINLANSTYVTSIAGHTANTYEDGFFTGWGANGTLKTNGSGKYNGSTIGMDIVAQTVPEPSALLLACFGGVGLAGYRFRRRSKSGRNR